MFARIRHPDPWSQAAGRPRPYGVSADATVTLVTTSRAACCASVTRIGGHAVLSRGEEIPGPRGEAARTAHRPRRNVPQYLEAVMARAGEAPEVVLEAAYGWYWAADTLAELGATVHLAHPLGVKMFSYRRVKNDQRDAA